MRALITGASRGIGRAIALRLCTDYEIIAAARSKDRLNDLAREIEQRGGRCTNVVVDLVQPSSIAVAFKGIEADVLVNNAGTGPMKPMLDLTPEEWHRMVDVNFNALYHVTRAILPGMLERRSGHVLMIGSISGRSAFVGGTCYAATKHAVAAFTECLMLEVRDQGVKVSVVNPGSVATSFSARADASWMLKPEDVAESVAHVLSTPPNVLVHSLEVRARAKQ
jgi:NADP-dependent 3-hydroxy acid dehydrogenase YdfG